MQRSMLAAMLGGGKAADSKAASEPDSDAEPEAEQAEAEAAAAAAAPAAAAAVPLPDMARSRTQQPQQPRQGTPDDDAPRTVFVRSLPAGTTEPQLRSAMSKFGPLKACRCALT